MSAAGLTISDSGGRHRLGVSDESNGNHFHYADSFSLNLNDRRERSRVREHDVARSM